MQTLSPRFRSHQIFFGKIPRETFYLDVQKHVWRRHVGAHLDGHHHGDRKPTETAVTEFWYKNLTLSLEELKNIKKILFSIQNLFR